MDNELPNDPTSVAQRTKYLVDMVVEMTRLIQGAHSSNYTAKGQNLRPLARAICNFGASITAAGTPERALFDEMHMLLNEEAGLHAKH